MLGFAAEIRRHCLQVIRQRRRCSTEQVAGERRLQGGNISGEPAFVGLGAAIEGARHALDLTADAEVSGTHFTQRSVKIGKHRVEETLRQRRRVRLLAFQTSEIKKRVQRDQLKPPIDAIGNPEIDKKAGLARLFDNAAVGEFGGLSQRIASKQGQTHQQGRRPDVDSTALSAKVKSNRWAEFCPVSTRTLTPCLTQN